MKCKQVVSQVRNVKQWKAIRKPFANTSNLFRGSSHCSTSPPSPLWKISTKFTKRIFRLEPLHPRGLQMVYTRPEYPTPTNPTSTQEGSQHNGIQVTWWSKDHKLSLTPSYRVEYDFWLKKESEKNFSWKEVKRTCKLTEKLLQMKDLCKWKKVNFSSLLKTWNLDIFLVKNKRPMTSIYREWINNIYKWY